MHMKDGWRVAEPVLASQPMESPTLSEAAAVALARDEDLENLTSEMMSAFGGAEGMEGLMNQPKEEAACLSAAGLVITILSESASWTASLISANGATRGLRTRRFSGHACRAAA